MRVFMLGWEFPPFISGGLGTACYGLTKAMAKLDVDVIFALPKSVDEKYTSHVKIISPTSAQKFNLTKSRIESKTVDLTDMVYENIPNLKFRPIDSPLKPYDTQSTYQQRIEQILRKKRAASKSLTYNSTVYENFTSFHYYEEKTADYSGDMYTETQRYARLATQMAMHESFDIVHAHDWMTFPAAIAVSAMTGKSLVVQVHSTEFDRSGENVNQIIYDIERKGMHASDRIIAVSGLTKKIIVERYGIDPSKVDVVYNGVDRKNLFRNIPADEIHKEKGEKLVLFLGRITMQKGPEYFLTAAKKVLGIMDNVKFVMAGSGDLMHKSVEMAAELGIGHKVLFTGFLRGDDVNRVFQMADLFVMPSVSEPFGIVPLEALDNDVPVIISKQSGVAEILKHALKVDFWDVEEMANKIAAVLKYPALKVTLQNHGNFEVRKLKWADAARQCLDVYEKTLCTAALN